MSSGKIKLTFTTCILIDGEYWFTEDRFNGLFAYNPVSEKTRHIHTFSSIRWNAVAAFTDKIIQYNSELFFFPCDSDLIVVYDMETHQDQAVKIDCYRGKVFDVSMVGRKKDKVLFASNDNCCIYELDLKTKKTRMNSNLTEAVKKTPGIDGITCVYIAGELWLAVCGTNILYQLDMAWEISKKWVVPCDELKISSLASDGELFWFTQRWSSDVVSWNVNTGEIEKFEIINNDWLDGTDAGERKMPYHNIVIGNGEIILVNCTAKYMLKFIPDKKKFIERIGDSADIKYYEESYFGKEGSHGFYQYLENEIWTSQIMRNKIIKYNVQSKKCITLNFEIDKREIPDFQQGMLKSFDDIQVERHELFCLEDLFGILDSSDCRGFIDNNVGKKIYDCLAIIG